MPKKKISDLPAGSALTGIELVPIVQTGTTKRITAQDIANLGNASGVEGSGTINYLAKFSATSTIANSQIFDNGTAIGIGTITPLGLLHLFKASATTRLVMDGNASQSKIITYRTNGVQRFGMYLNNTPESGSNVGSDFQIRAYSDAGALLSTPILIKRSTGLVTIGGELKVSTADANLNLQGTTKSYVLQVVDSNNKFRIFDNTANVERFSIATGGAATFSSSITAGDDIISTNGTISSILSYSSTYGGVIGTISNHNANIYTNGTPKLTITPAGNVGIGVSSPNVELALFNASTPRFHLQNTASGTGTTDGLQLALSSSDAYIWNFENGATIFGTNNAEKMRITSAGNVGIGTTSGFGNISGTETTLHIANSNVASIYLNSTASKKWGIYSSGSGRLNFENLTDAINALTIFSNGNIGINTTTDAGYKLDVNGTARVSGTVTFSNTNPILDFVRTNNSTNPVAQINFKTSQGTVRWQIGTNQSSGLGYEINEGDATNNRFYIAPGGAATFSSSLSVGASTNGRLGVRGTTNDSSAYAFEAANSSGSTLFIVRNDGITSVDGKLLVGTFTPGGSPLKVVGLPTSPAGLSTGDVWNNLGILTIV